MLEVEINFCVSIHVPACILCIHIYDSTTKVVFDRLYKYLE